MMHSKSGVRSVGLMLALAIAGTGHAGDAVSASNDDKAAAILARHRAVSGAEEHLAAIETLTLRGRAEAGPMAFTVVEERKRSGKVRLEFVIDGKTIIQASDGSDAWWLDPVMGSGKVEAMPDSYGRGFRQKASIDDFYLLPADGGVEVEWIGEVKTDDGRVLDEVRVAYADGAHHWRSFDRATGRYVRKRVASPQGEMIANFSDYREVAGVWMPFQQHLSFGQAFLYDEAEVNRSIDDARFARPKS